jgi:uncharacterized protein with GYD domain
MFQATFTAEGARGVLKGGGSARRAAIEKLTDGLGGTVECFYFAFGGDDVYIIVDLPDHESAVAASMTASAAGATQVRTIVLLTPEQIDAAAAKSVDYTPPGG